VDLPAVLFGIRSLVRDTIRHSLAARTFWLLLAATVLCVGLCLSVRVEGVTAYRPKGEIELYGGDAHPFTGFNRGTGMLSLGFGLMHVDLGRDREQAVHFLEGLLVLGAGSFGLLLGLVWTAGFLPDFLEPNSAAVLLAKPVPRWSLLVGKYLGVLAFVFVQLAIFIGGTWVALGLKTGVWLAGYLVALPLLLLLFALFYAFSVVVATYTRSTVVCIVGSVAFLTVCSAVNTGRHAAVAASPPGSGESGSAAAWPWKAGYWVLPKPTDVILLMAGAVEADKHFRAPTGQGRGGAGATFAPELSLLTSLLFTAALLGLAARRFHAAEY
jgi:ABC-type transport system involved in multi-copper enzyme maturation permease subunit